MALMAEGLSVTKSSTSNHDQADGRWWTEARCPVCGIGQFYVIAGSCRRTPSSLFEPSPDGIRFLRCARCGLGLVDNEGSFAPGAMRFRSVRGLGRIEAAAWAEVRAVLSVSAWTAAVMLCRKIILHVAVAHGLDEKDGSGRSPTFDKAVKHLLAEGLITPPMKPWVDHIRTVGNEANHELPATAEESAMRVATFTEQLLILAYEMPAVMSEALPPPQAQGGGEIASGESVAV